MISFTAEERYIVNQDSSKFRLDSIQGPSYIRLTFSFKLNFFASKAQHLYQWVVWTVPCFFPPSVGVDLRLR